MTLDEYRKLAAQEAKQGRKNLLTAYVFLLISAVFFGLFFWNAQELPIIGCAFLCDAAALVYLLRALGRVCPLWQAGLARRLSQDPSPKRLYELCAALEIPKNPRYGAGVRAALADAQKACDQCPEVSQEECALLADTLDRYAGAKL